MEIDHRQRRLLRVRNPRPCGCASKRDNQFTPSDRNCHAPLPCGGSCLCWRGRYHARIAPSAAVDAPMRCGMPGTPVQTEPAVWPRRRVPPPLAYFSRAAAPTLRAGLGQWAPQLRPRELRHVDELLSAKPVDYHRTLVDRPISAGEGTPAASEFAPAARGFYERRFGGRVRRRRCSLFAMCGGVEAVLHPVFRASHALQRRRRLKFPSCKRVIREGTARACFGPSVRE